MDPVAEPEVRPVAAAKVEHIGNWEPVRVTVGRISSHVSPAFPVVSLIPKSQRSPPLICTEQP